MGRLVLRVLFVLAGVLVLAAVVVVGGIGWAHHALVQLRTPLPPAATVAAWAAEGDVPIRLSWINTATQTLPRAAVVDEGGSAEAGAAFRMAYPVFALEWADGRLLLVDAGMDEAAARAFGAPIERVTGGEAIEPLTDVAAALGAARERVAGIVFTHLHEDHVQGLAALCRAGGAPIDVLIGQPQFDHANYTTRGGVQAIPKAPCGRVRMLASGPIEALPGFPGTAAVPVAGHTPGSQLIVARVGTGAGAALYVLAGDVVNAFAAIERDLPKPWLYRTFAVPEDEGRLGELRRYLRTLETQFAAVVLPSHDQMRLEAAPIRPWGSPT